MDNAVGEKIRKFRKRAGVSQFELELRINASPGSISRIESGQVNPTKETLQKVIQVLDLRSYESSSLFDLDFNELPRMVQVAKRLSRDLDLDRVLQDAVNDIVAEMNLLGSVIFLCEEGFVYVKAMTQNSFTKLTQDILPLPYNHLRIEISGDIDNLVAKSIRERRPQYSIVFNSFCKGFILDKLADFIQKMNGTKCTLCLPIEVNNEVLGAILFSKGYVDNFELERNILKTFVEHIGTTISNAKKYSDLKNEYEILKNNKKYG